METYLGLFFSAFLAATLVTAVNWAIGRYLLHYRERRWFPFKGESLDTAQRWFQKFGIWSLLLAWLPIGGDALTFIGKAKREVAEQ